MGIAYYYIDIYLVVVSFLLFAYFQTTSFKGADGCLYLPESRSASSTIVLCCILIFFIGLRPISPAFVDTMNYAGSYDSLEGTPYVFITETDNIIFDNILPFFAAAQLGCSSYFLFIAIIYFGGMAIISRKFFPYYTYIGFIVFLSAFETFSAATNGIKAGAAASVFLIALAYKDKYWVSIPLLLASLGFHHSMILPVVAYFCVLFKNSPRLYLIIWSFCLVISLLHITFFQTFFAGFTYEHGAEYLLSVDEAWNGRVSGFRYDFVLYSFAPILVGYYSIFKRGIEDKLYYRIFNIYVLCNSIWLLCMYANFTNRIAYLSWFLYPVVLIYPFFLPQFGKDRFTFLRIVAICHLGFTLFMHIIYY